MCSMPAIQWFMAVAVFCAFCIPVCGMDAGVRAIILWGKAQGGSLDSNSMQRHRKRMLQDVYSIGFFALCTFIIIVSSSSLG